jgi:uncharacterized protein
MTSLPTISELSSPAKAGDPVTTDRASVVTGCPAFAGQDEGGGSDAYDTGPRSGGSERFCVVERVAKPVDELIRFVAGPDGTLVPDIKRKLPGRGVWVTATRAALDKAVKRSAFPRSLKESIRIPADLPDLVDRLLVRAALDALAMANKAGRVVAGFERVDGAIAAGSVAAVIHAAEASPDGVRKLAATQARRDASERTASRLSSPATAGDPVTTDFTAGRGAPKGPAPGVTGCPAFAEHDAEDGVTELRERIPVPLVRAFTASQLGLALGRPNVIHAALLGGREGDSFLARWRTLDRYRSNEDGDEPTRAGIETMQPDAASELGTE